MRHLPEIAKRRGVDETVVRGVWNQLVVPNVRFVNVRPGDVEDRRVDSCHEKDRHIARVAALLAPAVLVTDNRKHFGSFGLDESKTDAVAMDLYNLGEFGVQSKGVVLVGAMPGVLSVEGSKKVIDKLGRDAAIVIGLLLLGGAMFFLRSERGKVFHTKLGEFVREVGPPMMERMAEAEAARTRVGAFAIDRVSKPDALAAAARYLAGSRPVMTTKAIEEFLGLSGYRFESGRAHATQTRAWLKRTTPFHEVERGHWSLGFHAAELSLGEGQADAE